MRPHTLRRSIRVRARLSRHRHRRRHRDPPCWPRDHTFGHFKHLAQNRLRLVQSEVTLVVVARVSGGAVAGGGRTFYKPREGQSDQIVYPQGGSALVSPSRSRASPPRPTPPSSSPTSLQPRDPQVMPTPRGATPPPEVKYLLTTKRRDLKCSASIPRSSRSQREIKSASWSSSAREARLLASSREDVEAVVQAARMAGCGGATAGDQQQRRRRGAERARRHAVATCP